MIGTLKTVRKLIHGRFLSRALELVDFKSNFDEHLEATKHLQ
jgi:hypothetical protein